MIRLCFVCLGNICRSPTAEGVMRHLLDQTRLGGVEVDSAGTSGYHVGEPPDRRATLAAKRRGILLAGRSRRFVANDFARFDFVVAMDRSNLDDLFDLAPDRDAEEKLSLLRDHDPNGGKGLDVPDPYYGGEQGFDEVLDICERACRGLLALVKTRLGS